MTAAGTGSENVQRWVPWSGAEIAAFRRMWKEGRPVRDIASTLRRTPETIYMQRVRLGLPPRRIRRPAA